MNRPPGGCKLPLEEQFSLILDLPDNWDDEGAPAFNKEKLDCLQATLASVTGHLPMPYVYPNFEGGVDAQWMGLSKAVVAEVYPSEVVVISTSLAPGSKGTTVKFNLDIPSEVESLPLYLRLVVE